MATTEKLPSGRYRGIYYDSAGAKHRTPTTDRKRDALAAARDAEVEAKRQASASAGTLPGHTTYAEWRSVWWTNRDIEPSTEDAEARAMRRHIAPYWDSEEMARIAQPDVQSWITHMHRVDGLGGSYVRRIYNVFRSSINAAVPSVLNASPCVGVKLPPKSGGGIERVYETEELEAIQEHLTPSYKFVTSFIPETGLRPGEFAGLHRWRIDRKNGWLVVRDTYDRTSKRIKSYPKDADERAIPLTSRALDLLDEYDETRPPSKRVNCGIPHQHGKCKSDILFRGPMTGLPLNTNTFYSLWRRAQTLAKITPFGRPYDLRHLYATRLAEAGVDAWEIARLMGHASLDQGIDYIHRTRRARMRVLAALGDPAAQGLTALDGGLETVENVARPISVPRAEGFGR